MAVLDFKEIPEAHVANGLQDSFELFAREFLEFRGFKIISSPDRGADGGKDLIVEEHRHGIGGVTIIRCLVSCKHNAHSGSSVTPTVEQNIIDRLNAHNCSFFMGFYSTVPSSGLTANLDGFKDHNNIEYFIYDREWIERLLLDSDYGRELTRRFFPISFGKWEREPSKPAEIFKIDISSIYADNMIQFLGIDENNEAKLYLKRDLMNLLLKLSNIHENLRLLLFNIILNGHIEYPNGSQQDNPLYMFDYVLAYSNPNFEIETEILCQAGLMHKSDRYDSLDFDGKYRYMFVCFIGKCEVNIFRIMKIMYGEQPDRLYKILVGCDFSKL